MDDFRANGNDVRHELVVDKMASSAVVVWLDCSLTWSCTYSSQFRESLNHLNPQHVAPSHSSAVPSVVGTTRRYRGQWNAGSTLFLDPAVQDEYLGTPRSLDSCSKASLSQDFLDLLKDVADSLSCRSKLVIMAVQM